MTSQNEALRKAQGGEHERYLGMMRPPVGQTQWDPEEQVFAVRLTIDDEEFSCGAECCGYQSYAVVAVRLGGEPCELPSWQDQVLDEAAVSDALHAK